MKAKLVKESLKPLNESPEEKDIKRIEDIFKRGKGSDEKVLQLSRTMAKSINNPEKALRRAEAAWQLLGKKNNPIADYFLERYKELTGHEASEETEVSKETSSFKPEDHIIPKENPKVNYSELERGYRGRVAGANSGVIFLPTYSSIALWEWEITGQLSDGAWENSKPDDHWIYWSNLVPRFGKPEVQSTGYPRKTGYNLAGLIEYVGDRMLMLGKFGKAVGPDIFKMGSEVRYTVENFPKDGPFDIEEFLVNQQRIHSWMDKEYYWKGLEQKHVDAFYKTKYDMRDLRRDLAYIKQAMHSAKR